MVNGLRMIFIISIACVCMTLTGLSRTKVVTVPQRVAPVAVGETAPDFTLEDQSGGKVMLSESRGKNPVVLVFYRGYW